MSVCYENRVWCLLTMFSNRCILLLRCRILKQSEAFYSGEWGSGAGKGGGSGGAVRDAGGSFGKMEAAREEEYFRKLQRKQFAKLKEHMKEEILHHEKLIQQHKEAIQRLE
ncbi:ATPase inhibitor mai-2, mitochondrial, partial [Stegodyphus mimosarum]